MNTREDQDPDTHKPEFYNERDGRVDLPEHVIWFRGERREIRSLTQDELRCALMDAHTDLLQVGRAVTRIEVRTEDDAAVRNRIGGEIDRAQQYAWRHQATQ